jgi:hypothetical protein
LSGDVIDIKPDDRKNTIVRSVPQTVGVAIFSRRDNSVPPELLLDATDIDPATLILRGTGGATWALPVKQNAQGEFQCNTRDVDRDGLIDLVCSFLIPANTLGLQETRVVLEGRTVETPGGRREIHASDLVRVLP